MLKIETDPSGRAWCYNCGKPHLIPKGQIRLRYSGYRQNQQACLRAICTDLMDLGHPFLNVIKLLCDFDKEKDHETQQSTHHPEMDHRADSETGSEEAQQASDVLLGDKHG